MQKHNYFIITGAPGSGKTSLINSLRDEGHRCIAEPAREIIAEQKIIDGPAIYEKEPRLFIELMLSRFIYTYNLNIKHKQLVLFDRGIPDIIAYARLANKDFVNYINAANIYQYNINVFYLPVWDKIYINDHERKMSHKAAKEFDKIIRQSNMELNYKIIEVPLVNIQERTKFVEKMLS